MSSDSTVSTEVALEIKHGESEESKSKLDAELEAGHETNAADGPHPETFGPAPDGGLKAWLVATGGFCIFFCCLGFANSFGAFEEYYLAHQLHGESPDNIAWIGSVSSFLQFAVGMIAGPLFDRHGAKVIRPAAIAYIFSIMMLSLCKTYWQIMLAQGILMGISMGLLQFPALGAVLQYFDKKRAAAMGVVVSGSSIGGIITPIAVSKMLNGSSLGFGWSVRIVGFMMLPFVAVALLTITARLPPKKTAFWLPSAYRDPTFALLIISLLFSFMGIFMPLFFIPTYAVSRGMDPILAGDLSAILNAASTFGRIIPGVLADKYGRLNVYALGGILSSIVIFCMNSATTNAGLIVYSIAIGFTTGTIISGATSAFSMCSKDPREMGTYMGMGMFVAAFGGLIGPPVNGVFISHFGGFFQVSMFSGAMTLLGGGLVVLAKFTTPQGLLGRV